MRGTLLVITAAAGAVVGAAVTHSLNRDRARVPTLAVEPASAQATAGVGVAAPRAADAARARSTTAERAEIYRAAAAADSRELAAMIHAAAEQPPSAARTFALEALLGRYAEIDPEEAIAVAEEAGLDTELRAPLYAAWAATDSASALAALSEVNDPAAARTIALALLPLLGGDERALRQVAAAVPFGAETLLYAEAIGTRAGTAPAAALEQALALTDLAARSFALERVAASWAAQDPRTALTAGDAIADPELQRLFTGYVGRQWVRLDPDGALDYLVALGNGPRSDLLVSMGAQLAQQRPRELLSLAASLPAPTQLPLRTMAIQALANEDPALALREAEALPAGGQRESAIAAIARSYGARDPEGALAWAQASGEPSRLMGVLSGIAQRDPERAFDLAAALEAPLQRTQAIQGVIMGSGIGLATNPATLADRVLTLNDTAVRSNALRMLLARWSSMAPEDAADWLVTQQLSNVPGSYQQLATQLAQSNPAQAAEYTVRMPAAARSEWLQGVAQGYAQHDRRRGGMARPVRGDPATQAASTPWQLRSPHRRARSRAFARPTNDPRIGMQAPMPWRASGHNAIRSQPPRGRRNTTPRWSDPPQCRASQRCGPTPIVRLHALGCCAYRRASHATRRSVRSSRPPPAKHPTLRCSMPSAIPRPRTRRSSIRRCRWHTAIAPAPNAYSTTTSWTRQRAMRRSRCSIASHPARCSTRAVRRWNSWE
jgi:hypothetical protein